MRFRILDCGLRTFQLRIAGIRYVKRISIPQSTVTNSDIQTAICIGQICRPARGTHRRWVGPESAIRNRKGFTLLEVIIVITILSVMTAAAIPLVRNTVRRERESELRLALRQLRQAIDAYKFYHDRTNGMVPIEWKTQSGYPKNLEILVEGFIPPNVVGTSGNRVRFLRRLPVDPMTGDTEWGLRSYKDEPDSTSWGGEDVFDVYSKSNGEALNGTKYKDW